MWQAPSLGTPPHLPQPKVVTDTDDTDEEGLRTQMEELRLAKEEVARDDDTSVLQEGVAVEDSEEASAP